MMSIASWKKDIHEKIKKLNSLKGHSLNFLFEEDKNFICVRGIGPHGERFGIFEPTVFFEDCTDKEKAYQAMATMITMLLAGTKLNDPAAYHNQKCNIVGQ